jgi:hypothetical protein
MKKFAVSLLPVLLAACTFLFPIEPTIELTAYTGNHTGLAVALYNNCVDETVWHITMDGPEQRSWTLNPGFAMVADKYTDNIYQMWSPWIETPGTYTITEWTDDNVQSKKSSRIVIQEDGLALYSRFLCGATQAPAKYYLANNCVGTSPTDSHANTVWHWTFQMVAPANADDQLIDPIEVIIPLGESASGELPGGMYLVRDWTENGAVDNPAYVATTEEIGYIYVNLCPDNPPLPDAPTQP